MLYIRADMNQKIATGHIMRCLSIADAAREMGEDTTFILADEQAVSLVRERGYQTIVLYSVWDDMETELDTLQKIIEEYRIRSLLIDSYMVTPNYLRVLSEQVGTIYLDDLNAFYYPVHALICYAAYWEKFSYQERYREAKLLLGLSYAPLRKVFSCCKKKEIKTTIEHLLILSGGTDNFRILERLLQKIEIRKYKRIDVICGKYYENYEEFCSQYRDFPQVYFHKAVSNMEDYMQQADMAVSAGGTTLYELCACGTPTISYSFADNQLDNVDQFQKDNLIDYAGDVRDTDIFENVNRILNKYFYESGLRRERSERMQKLVDGKGAGRIAEALAGLSGNDEGILQMRGI